MHSSIALLLALFSLVAANPFDLPPGFHRYAPRQSTVDWRPCPNDKTSTRGCARFEVPLDYTNEAAGKASLAVARLPAVHTPRLGTLFVNPGGPGASGVDLIMGGHADVVMNATGGQYDVVSWDPRGVGQTIPRVGCFASAAEENAFWNGTIPNRGLEARGNFTDPADLEAFYAQVPEVDALLIKLGQKCQDFSQDTLQYVGTTATVRDLVTLHDSFEGSHKPVNYWGLSYGTAIGIYFVNMYPNRVGRVVLDGVVDPVYWANRPAHEIWSINAESTDEAVVGFTQACAAAGPGSCAFSSPGSTPESLYQKLWQMIDLAYTYRKTNPQSEFGSSDIRDMLFSGMYTPTTWPNLAVDLQKRWEALTSSSPAKRSLDRQISNAKGRQTPPTNPEPAQTYAITGITCADAVDPGNVTTRDVFDYLVTVTRTVSAMFGPSWGIAGFDCHRWPVRAVERFTGPWSSKLSNPILIIGNEADPITPFRSAKSVADALGDSAVLIEQDDWGHLSVAMHSDCTIQALTTYFAHNILPTGDKVCGTNQQLFPGPGITKSMLASVSSANTTTSPSNLQSELDKTKTRARQLLIAAIALAGAAVLLLVSLIATCIFKKRKGAPHKDIAYWGADGGSTDQGHNYEMPYDGVGSLKSGGYAPVKM